MKRIFYALSLILALLAMTLNAVPALAATSSTAPPAVSDTSTGLSITPRKNLALRPGQTVSDNLSISNLDQHSDLNIAMRVIDFTYMNQGGTPKLMVAQNAPQTTWSLKPFLNVPGSIIVPAGQTRQIPYSVKIPTTQGAGSYYSAIEYSATSGNGGNVNLNASGVTLIFVTISGTVHEDLRLQKFGAYQPGAAADTGKYISIATDKPQQIAYTLQNYSNVAESPFGTITLKYMFGNKQIMVPKANANSSLVLLGQTRLFTSCISSVNHSVLIAGALTKSSVCASPSLWPGKYTLALDVFYGQNGNPTKEVTGAGSFWYLPWWFIGGVIAIVLLIAFVTFMIIRRTRRRLYGRPLRRTR